MSEINDDVVDPVVDPFGHELCLHCMTVNDDMDAICLNRGRQRCQELPCPDFKHCENGAKEHELCKVITREEK